METESYSTAVKYFSRARRTLDHYKHMPSFKGIEDDCSNIILKLKSVLREKFNSENSTPGKLIEAADLLMQLDEPVQNLVDCYIQRSFDMSDSSKRSRPANRLFCVKGRTSGSTLTSLCSSRTLRLQSIQLKIKQPALTYLNSSTQAVQCFSVIYQSRSKYTMKFFSINQTHSM
jgi:hypothetical protein